MDDSKRAPGRNLGPYLVHHWRGEQSLPRSYWLNSIVIAEFGGNLLWLFATRMTYEIFLRQASIAVAACVVLTALQIGASVWALTGTWRAARVYRGPHIWSILARIGISLCVFVSIGINLTIAFYLTTVFTLPSFGPG